MGPTPEELLARIPLDAKQVVEIGCGAGALGRAFRRRNPDIRWCATEADPARAAEARGVLDEVLELEAGTTLPHAPGSLDALVMAQGIERLADPWGALRGLVPLLSDDGVLLLATPNPFHWQGTASLLRGEWPDARFRPDQVRHALAEIGLHVVDAHRCGMDPAAFEAHAAQIAPALAGLGVAPADYAGRAAHASVLWRATRRPPRPLAIVGRTLRPQAAMIEVRMAEPLFALASRPGVSVRLGTDPRMPRPPAGVPAIFILQRVILSPAAIAYLRAIRDAGYLIVQEFDDDPRHNSRIAAEANMAFSAVHAVQASTEPLAALLRPLNPEVGVMPNMLSELPEPTNFRDPRRLTLFFGALNRERDIAPFLPVLNAVLAAAGDRLAVEVVHDRGVFDALETPHKRFTPLCDYTRYKAMMGASEIAFLPLADTPFNRMKSDLKWVEASGHGLVSIASPVVYADSIRHGETGFVAGTPEAVAAALRDILADPARAQAIGRAARAEVAATRLHVHGMARRRAWYDSLWSRRAELDAALLARVPQLAR